MDSLVEDATRDGKGWGGFIQWKWLGCCLINGCKENIPKKIVLSGER